MLAVGDVDVDVGRKGRDGAKFEKLWILYLCYVISKERIIDSAYPGLVLRSPEGSLAGSGLSYMYVQPPCYSCPTPFNTSIQEHWILADSDLFQVGNRVVGGLERNCVSAQGGCSIQMALEMIVHSW